MTAPLTVTCGIICQTGRLLLAQRRDNGLWELPGGKLNPGETLAACLQRELQEELNITVEVLSFYQKVEQANPPLHLHAFVCRLQKGQPQALEHLAITWVRPQDMTQYQLCSADRILASSLAADQSLSGKFHSN